MLYVAVLLVVAGGVFSSYQFGHRAGYDEMSTECQVMIDRRRRAHDSELERMRQEWLRNREGQVQLTTRLVNEQKERNEELENQLKYYRAQSDGLRISASACRNGGRAMPSTGASASEFGAGVGPEGTIRLPVQIESGLWDIVHDARKVVIDYENCRRELCSRTECL